MSSSNSSVLASLQELQAALFQADSLIGAAVVSACLGVAWLVVRLLRRDPMPSHSVWFGRSIVDGLLFPALALALAYAARSLLLGFGVSTAVFRVVIPVLLSLALIRLSVRVLSAAFPASQLMRTAERTISWIAWLGVVAWLTGILPQILDDLDQIHWKLGGSLVSVRTMIEGALSAGFVLMLVLWVSSALEDRLLRGAAGEQLSLRKAAANALRAILVFVGLLVALSAVGIDLTALSVLGGAVGVGLGLGLQKLAANYVSGFVILAERSLRIGDIVKVDQFEGRITDITTRYTVIRAPSGREAIVPNEMLITQKVENLSLADRNILLTSPVSVAYGTDLSMLVPRLVARIRAVDRVRSDPEPQVLLNGFGADGLDLMICFWIGDPENGQGNVRSAVNLEVLRLFEELAVSIPYPQRVVRVETPIAAALTKPAG